MGNFADGGNVWEYMRGNYLVEVSGNVPWNPMQDYKSLRLAVIICAALINTQTHRQTAFGRLYYWLSQMS